MSSPSFGLPGTSNNAPPPVPGNTNPTGTNKGVGFGGVSFPNYPVFGAPQTGSPVTPSANAPLFSGTNMQGLSTGFSSANSGNLLREFERAYGKGTGSEIFNLLSNGLFNPQEAAAFLNAMQPSINQGLASVQNSFGAEGSRFGSAAALGIGNYESQVNLNEQQTLASMYMQAQQEQLQLLESTLPTLHSEEANADRGWYQKLIGAEEIVAGVFTGSGGAVQGGNSLLFGNQGAVSGGSGGGGSIPSFGTPGIASFSSGPYNNQTNPVPSNLLLDASAGSDLGGASFDPAMFAGLL